MTQLLSCIILGIIWKQKLKIDDIGAENKFEYSWDDKVQLPGIHFVLSQLNSWYFHGPTHGQVAATRTDQLSTTDIKVKGFLIIKHGVLNQYQV